MKNLKVLVLLLVTAASFSSCVVRERSGGWVRGHYEIGARGGRVWIPGHYR
jgi:hypothetical protein